jgi:hypothetical protein
MEAVNSRQFKVEGKDPKERSKDLATSVAPDSCFTPGFAAAGEILLARRIGLAVFVLARPPRARMLQDSPVEQT